MSTSSLSTSSSNSASKHSIAVKGWQRWNFNPIAAPPGAGTWAAVTKITSLVTSCPGVYSPGSSYRTGKYGFITSSSSKTFVGGSTEKGSSSSTVVKINHTVSAANSATILKTYFQGKNAIWGGLHESYSDKGGGDRTVGCAAGKATIKASYEYGASVFVYVTNAWKAATPYVYVNGGWKQSSATICKPDGTFV